MNKLDTGALRDRPGTVREENALDLDRLLPWLQRALPDLPNTTPNVAQYGGGASNLTYALDFGAQTIILRRPPAGTKPKSGHDMGREFRVLQGLHGHYPVPRPLASCEDDAVIGAPFYVMEKLDGIIVRRDLPDGLLLPPDDARALSERLWDQLVALHLLSPEQCGLQHLGKPEGYVARQVAGWNSRYQKARTDDAPVADDIMQWLEDHQISENGRASLLHNDYRFDNVVLSPDDELRVIGVLDWELCTIGDPLLDLGCALAYWVTPEDPDEMQAVRMQPSHLPGMPDREAICARYAQMTGYRIDQLDFYLAFGLFRLAVIVQQIYYRYAKGQTSNPRYRAFGPMVHVLVNRARNVAGLA